MKTGKNLIVLLTFATFLILLDQLSKYLIRSQGGFYICNQNIAFGIIFPDYLSYPFWIIIILLIILFLNLNIQIPISNKAPNPNKKILGFLTWNFIGNLSFDIGISKPHSFPLILIMSGAFSNVIDRLYFGCVIDFIDLKFWPASIAIPLSGIAGWPVFNIADVYITVGAIILITKYLVRNK